MQTDTLIHARWVIPVEPEGITLDHHSVAITNGEIVNVMPSGRARQEVYANEIIELTDHALIPGLINAHTHAAMSMMRGYADDLPLDVWLHQHIWPAEARWVDEAYVQTGSELAIAEMIKSGTTCFNDMYFFGNVTGRVAIAAKMRAVIGLILIDFPTQWAQNTDEYLSKASELHDEFRHTDLITTAFAPHAPYTVSDEALEKTRVLADELDVPIHIHVHETALEVTQAIAKDGVRPLEKLSRMGLVTPRLLAVHMTQLLDAEIEAIATAGVHVLHCPKSNSKLANGFCPVRKLREAGVNIALGTDSAASNNTLDMLSEMRMAALVAKGGSLQATALPAAAALSMATINGARALGLDDRVGSIVAGKRADVTAINLKQVNTQPVYDAVSQIVYSADRSQVSDVWIDGEHVLHNGTLTTMDEDKLLYDVQTLGDKIMASRFDTN